MRRAVVTALLLIAPIAARAATVTVTVGPGLSFTPSSVNIVSGDTVQWNWAGALHSSTSNTNSGPEVWDSTLKSTGSFSHTFTTVGNWGYYCTLHSTPGGTAMNGVVHVSTAAPTLTSVNPSAGPTAGGTSVTLTGTKFAAGCGVTFGATPAASAVVQNATTIIATTPAHAAATVSVAVGCPAGTATLTNAFTFADAPTIIAVTPLSAPPGTAVTITGAAFQNGAAVMFGGTAAAGMTFVNAGTLNAVVPNIAPGPVTITVTNPDAQSATFSGFTVLPSTAIPLLDPRALWLLAAVLAAVGAIALSVR